MALTKVAEAVLLALQSIASNSFVVGGAIDVSTYYAADVKIRMGRGTGTAFTIGPRARLEVSYVASPTADDWVSAAEFQMAIGATIGSQAVSGTEAAGQTVVTLAAGTNFAAGDYVFFHNTTIGNSEWCRVSSVAAADLTLEEGLVAAQTGSTCRDQSEQYHAVLDVTSVQRMRLVVDGAGSGQAVICEATFGAVTAL